MLTRLVRKQPWRQWRVQASFDSADEIRWDWHSWHYVFEDKSLMFKLLPLWCCERRPVSCTHHHLREKKTQKEKQPPKQKWPKMKNKKEEQPKRSQRQRERGVVAVVGLRVLRGISAESIGCRIFCAWIKLMALMILLLPLSLSVSPAISPYSALIMTAPLLLLLLLLLLWCLCCCPCLCHLYRNP